MKKVAGSKVTGRRWFTIWIILKEKFFRIYPNSIF